MTITTHPDYIAILRNVLHAPNDDLPRLVLADWLDEPERTGSVRCEKCGGRGEQYSMGGPESDWEDCPTCNGQGCVSNGNAERSDLIRGMCWMHDNHTDCPTRMTDYARSRPVPMRCGACEYCTTRRRCEKIYSKVQWLNGLNYAVYFDPTALDGMMPTGPGITIGIARGFVGSIRLTAEQFMQHAAELFSQHPITEVVLSDVDFDESSILGDERVALPSERIPSEIFRVLEYDYMLPPLFRTRNTALAALSRACVRVGRNLAELTELQLISQ